MYHELYITTCLLQSMASMSVEEKAEFLEAAAGMGAEARAEMLRSMQGMTAAEKAAFVQATAGMDAETREAYLGRLESRYRAVIEPLDRR
jgi:uncharacterized phage protein gp47/JayE